MMKLFLKTFYLVFLWIILLANLFIFFDMTALISNPLTTNNPSDISNSYFGVSTLINAFRNIDNLPIGSFARRIGDFQKWLYNTAVNLFNYGDFSNVVNKFENANSLFDQLDAILSIFTTIASFIGGIFTWMFAAFMAFFYFIILIFSLLWTILGFANGYYITPVPSSSILNTAYSIRNCITPLMSAVVGV